MKIAFYHRDLPVDGQKPGGVSVFVDRIATALVERGHELSFFTHVAPTNPRPYAVHVLRPGGALSRGLPGLYATPWLLNIRPDLSRFDVMHLHGDDWFYWKRPLPTVRTFYGSAAFEAATATSVRRRLNSTAVFALELAAGRRADAVYGIGSDSRVLYEADGILRLGLDPQDGIDRTKSPTILFIGTWEGRKRGAFLHRLFRETIRPAVPDARLVMVSDFAEPAEGVTFLSAPTDAELTELWRDVAVYCSPSRYEGLGIPYMEAMSHGVPVVASPNPGSLDVLGNGRYGDLVEDDDMAEAVIKLLRSPEHQQSRRVAAREGLERFAWPTVLAGYEAAYGLAIERFAASTRRRTGV